MNVIEDVVLRGAAVLDAEPYLPRLLPRLADILTLPSLQRIVDEDTRESARRILEDIAKGEAAAAQDARNALQAA
eukprot:CAMPEP_0180412406 /NCGR_PEP_ID=MMETSP0989-20121125/44522_1 /TAXON_ID=697907 /ORGANISM="non described non described, Strain CCMP2293" /LENGTH=74 /DNA_ID=CAMNT_0022416867 /DNA_START=1 /DNA_END=225 /DNA_ORIENTATION=+